MTSRDSLPQSPALTLWLTGLSGAGKSTLASALTVSTDIAGRPFAVLDGDVLRSGLCKDLGFSPAERHENVRRVAEVARLMNEAGVTVVCALISPMAADRALARAIVGEQRFVEIHVATPLATCEARDPKGLYKRARAGELQQFTGISSAYEVPASPALTLDTSTLSIEECVVRVLSYLSQRGGSTVER